MAPKNGFIFKDQAQMKKGCQGQWSPPWIRIPNEAFNKYLFDETGEIVEAK